MDLMYEFTNYKYDISKENLKNYISNNINCKIIVYTQKKKKIIGSGTIFKIEKLHNNPIGQIKDVIITPKYRNCDLSKQFIEKFYSLENIINFFNDIIIYIYLYLYI